MRIDHQGWFNNTSAIYQILSTFLVVGVILYFSKSLSSNKFVFTHYHNETGFESMPYVCTLGLLASLYGFSGYEGGATMAEETRNANESAPKGIVYSVIISAIVGFIFILAILYGA